MLCQWQYNQIGIRGNAAWMIIAANGGTLDFTTMLEPNGQYMNQSNTVRMVFNLFEHTQNKLFKLTYQVNKQYTAIDTNISVQLGFLSR